MEHELTLAMYRDRLDEIEALRAELAEAEARGYQRAIDELLAVPSHESHVAADWLEAQRDGRDGATCICNPRHRDDDPICQYRPKDGA